jgi:putative tryptophan/tyrosine transport system substrate-binding protein
MDNLLEQLRPLSTQGVRRIGVFSGAAEDDQDNKDRIAVFVKELQRLGWSDGRNLRIDYRFAAGNSETTI